VVQTDLLVTRAPDETIYINNVAYDIVGEAAKKVTKLPSAINLIGTQDGQNLVEPRMFLYTSTEGKGEPIREISIDNKALKEGWITVRSEGGLEPFRDIYEDALNQAKLGAKDDSDSYDHELVYSDQLYKWMEQVAAIFNPKDEKLSPFYIHCKKFDGDSLEDLMPYIDKLYIVEGESAGDALSKLVAFEPDGFVDCDLNRNAGGKKVYLAYKRTNSRSDAIRELAIIAGKNPVESKRISIGNGLTARFDLVANVDLNCKAGGSWLYLYATTSAEAGEPIRRLRIETNKVSNTANDFNEYTVRRANDSGFNNDNPDLNAGAGGDYLYMIVTKAVPTSSESLISASLFGDGSLRTVFVLASVAALVGVVVYGRKKESEASDEGAAS
jgi:hypothetical protein